MGSLLYDEITDTVAYNPWVRPYEIFMEKRIPTHITENLAEAKPENVP